MTISTLQSLFAYKRWANSELFALLATLPSSQSEQLHVCIRILNHIYVVDRIFRAHLSSAQHSFAATNTQDTPSLSQLHSDVEATDIWYENYVARLTEPALLEVLPFTFTDGDTGKMTREEILLHSITHGGYHRGNVGQVLKSISVIPPRDIYTKFLHDSEPVRRKV
jgi:uncharacterized damage-inducible protein DinB